MKYTIEGFSQEYATTLKKEITENGKTKTIKIDCTDLVILRWFVDFFPNMRKMNINGKEYALLVHSKMTTDLPILDISRKACIERMQKLVKFEILDYQIIKEGGTYSLYGFGNNYINMISKTAVRSDAGCTVNNTEGVRSNGYGVCGQTGNKDNSIINTSIKDKSIKNNILTEFETLWKIYPRKIGKPKALKAYEKARKAGTTFEQVENGINAYIQQIAAKHTETEYIKHGSTWFNGECWNDEYDTKPTQHNTVGANGIKINKDPSDLDGIL